MSIFDRFERLSKSPPAFLGASRPLVPLSSQRGSRPPFAGGSEVWTPDSKGDLLTATRRLQQKLAGELLVVPRMTGLTLEFTPEKARVAHATYSFANLHADLIPSNGRLILRCKARARPVSGGGVDERLAFIVSTTNAREVLQSSRYSCRVGADWRTLSFQLDVPTDVSRFEIQLRVPRNVRRELEATGLHLIGCDSKPFYLVPTPDWRVAGLGECALSKVWRLRQQKLTVTYLGEQFYLQMPRGWSLEHVDEKLLSVVNDYFFGPFEATHFGIERLFGSDLPPVAPIKAKHRTILSYSTGQDSTAALCVLPKGNPLYYCERDYDHFYTNSGARVELGWRLAEKHALEKVPECIRIPNNIELIRTRFGGRFGNPARQACVAFGILLSRFVDVSSISIGSPLETSFLQNGYNFVDVIGIRNSSFRRFRNLVRYIGLELVYPIGGLSEVITNRIVDMHADVYFAVPCPDTDDRFEPCGVCYKCFRKLRLSGKAAPQPDERTAKKLGKRPLKMAASTLYAAQLSGLRLPALEQYGSIDLEFLNRYLTYAVETLVPQNLQQDIIDRLSELGIEPLSTEDELKLREIGKDIFPEGYNEARSFPNGRPTPL